MSRQGNNTGEITRAASYINDITVYDQNKKANEIIFIIKFKTSKFSA